MGGETAVKKVVDSLYRKVVADEEISHFIEGLDITRQIEYQTAFLSMIFGHKDYQFSQYDLRKAQKYLVSAGLNNSHFDRLVEHLNISLKELELAEHEIGNIMERLKTIQDDILIS